MWHSAVEDICILKDQNKHRFIAPGGIPTTLRCPWTTKIGWKSLITVNIRVAPGRNYTSLLVWSGKCTLGVAPGRNYTSLLVWSGNIWSLGVAPGRNYTSLLVWSGNMWPIWTKPVTCRQSSFSATGRNAWEGSYYRFLFYCIYNL